jgi:hypothetical protein
MMTTASRARRGRSGTLWCGSSATWPPASSTRRPHHLGRLTVFAGVRDLPTRVKCAILPWHTLHAALHAQADEVSTEGDDPFADPTKRTAPGR